MLLVLTVHGELFRHMEHVILRILPVYVFQIETEHPAFPDGFRITFAQQQRIVDFLTGAHKAVGQRLVEVLHSPLNVGGRELVLDAGIGVPVQPAKLAPQDIFQQHMVFAAALFFAIFGRYVCVTHGLQKFNGGILAGVDLQIGVFVHEKASFRIGFRKHEERGGEIPASLYRTLGFIVFFVRIKSRSYCFLDVFAIGFLHSLYNLC